MSTNAVRESIAKFLATHNDDAVFNPTEGYYPFDVIAEAYEHGVKKGEVNLKQKVREMAWNNAEVAASGINALIGHFIDNGVDVLGVRLKVSHRQFGAFFTVNQSDYLSDEFYRLAYSRVAEVKAESFEKGIELTFGFIGDKEAVNEDALLADGYTIHVAPPIKKSGDRQEDRSV